MAAGAAEFGREAAIAALTGGAGNVALKAGAGQTSGGGRSNRGHRGVPRCHVCCWMTGAGAGWFGVGCDLCGGHSPGRVSGRTVGSKLLERRTTSTAGGVGGQGFRATRKPKRVLASGLAIS